MTEFPPINILESFPFVVYVDFGHYSYAKWRLFDKVVDELRLQDVLLECWGDILYCTEAGFEKLLCHPVIRQGLLCPRFSALRPALAWTVASEIILETRHIRLTSSVGDCAVAIRFKVTPKPGAHQIVFQSNVQEAFSRLTDPIDGPWYHDAYPKAVYDGLCQLSSMVDIRGYMMGGLQIELIGITDHPVDTHEHCFERVGSKILREIMDNASLVLLEPVMSIEIDVPPVHMADVLRDLEEREAEIGTQTANSLTSAIRVSQLLGFHNVFQRLTRKRGHYTLHRIRFDPIPGSESPDFPD